jgi:hypothetical protein
MRLLRPRVRWIESVELRGGSLSELSSIIKFLQVRHRHENELRGTIFDVLVGVRLMPTKTLFLSSSAFDLLLLPPLQESHPLYRHRPPLKCNPLPCLCVCVCVGKTRL